MATSQINENNNQQQSSYLIPATTTQTNENQILVDIKLICNQRRKKTKRYTYLTFVESRPNDQTCIEILGKTSSSIISFDDCISFEYFDTIKNDFQSFIYIYFESYTITLFFSDEHIEQKPVIIKHLDHMYQKKLSNQTKDKQISSNLPQNIEQFTTTEQILHTFDVKIIPYDNIITRDHVLVGQARIYFTTTDLYIAPLECKYDLLITTITNQCPSKDKQILCIPYFTIKHYGNRSKIFLIELGKSNYGDGEIHMNCPSSSLASTIHLLVSPVIEERPLALSSAFQNQLLTNKRREKSKYIQPPVQLTQEQPIDDKRSSIDSTMKRTNLTKSRSFMGFFRKFLSKSQTFNQTDLIDDQQLPINPNKFFELNIDETKFSINHPQLTQIPLQTIHQQLPTNETYLDMAPTHPKIDEPIESNDNHEHIHRESTATVDIGVNTIITIAPHIHSAIIVGNNVHIIAEERTVFPIGQRSFTSPASVMQPFKNQLANQINTNTNGIVSTSPTNSSSSLLLTYAFVTFNGKNSTNDIDDKSSVDRRLNSDLSVLSLTHQQQPSNIFSFNNLLSSSSSSHIFRTLSFPTNRNNSNGNILIFDDNQSDQTTTNYLLGPPPLPSITSESISDEQPVPSSNDCYALLESNPIEEQSPIDILGRSPRISNQTVIYTDVLFPTNTSDEQQYDENQCDTTNEFFDDKIDRSSTLLYTDIDFQQTQRRDRIGQLSAISQRDEQIPPFFL